MSRRLSLPVLGLTVAAASAAVLSLSRAPHRPFDVDEIATVAVVGDGSAAAIWRALGGAADGNAVNRTDSAERALTPLAPFLPLRLESRSQFLAAHSRFLLSSENEVWNWLPVRLMADGYSMRLVGRDTGDGTNHALFLVEASPSTPQGGSQ
jgi:hypothetical protein